MEKKQEAKKVLRTIQGELKVVVLVNVHLFEVNEVYKIDGVDYICTYMMM